MAGGDNAGAPGEPGLDAAARELADRLKGLADTLATAGQPTRISYGRGLIKHRSPAGFVLDAANRQLLLPDGRLWSHSSNDLAHPSGRYLDVRADYVNFVHSRLSLQGVTFVFLGVTCGRYTFGVVDGRLCALLGDGTSLRLVSAAEAFGALSEKLGKPGKHRR